MLEMIQIKTIKKYKIYKVADKGQFIIIVQSEEITNYKILVIQNKFKK